MSKIVFLSSPLNDNLYKVSGLTLNKELLYPTEIMITINSKKSVKMRENLRTLLSDYLKEVEKTKKSDELEVLTNYERAAIYAYTVDRYESLNEQLRKKNGTNDTFLGQYLDETLSKLPNVEGIIVHRCISMTAKMLSIYETAFENETPIIEHHFLSTSRDESIASMYLKHSKNMYQVSYRIFSKTGKDIKKYSKYDRFSGQNEKEILFRPNTEFEIVNISKSGKSVTITLNEIRKNGAT
ncbi:MAG: ADP-ribosyltransferase domain-containing protein [Saprospiraceae bacterium]|nr:ADP-ribosyltransferase domain-containing protein [Saprospiraceae bacterium]